MKKKVISHLADIAIENPKYMYQYTDGEYFYVTDGHRAIRYKEELITNPKITLNAHANSIIGVIKELFKYMESDGIMYELPNIEEIKEGITKVAGRAYSTKVAWGNEKFIVNARYLVKSMNALNAKVCYICEHNTHHNGIFLFENDDLQSDTCEIILPISKIKFPNITGFWKV